MTVSPGKNLLDKDFLDELTFFLENENPSKDDIAKKKVVLCRKFGLKKIPTDIEIFLNLKNPSRKVKELLRSKPVRTGSGVAVVALMTLPGKCPHGRCVFCPGGVDSFFGDVPQSYTGNEPATMRGLRNDFDAYLQVFNRLEQYVAIGQSPEKVELIIMGGTFISYRNEYREGFVRDAFNAMNDFSSLFFEEDFLVDKFKDFFELPGSIKDDKRVSRILKKIVELKKKNLDSLEVAKDKNHRVSRIKCVGLTIETKPDQGFKEHGEEMLRLGCTRVELGVQTLLDDVLKKVCRGHSISDTERSIRELRDLGFKLNFHMMPGLPSVSFDEELKVFEELFSSSKYRPDMLKIYPLMVMPGTVLFDDYKKGLYDPLSTKDAVNLLSKVIPLVPEYCRVMRVQRDIPPKYAVAGPLVSNLRQLVDEKILSEKRVVREIRHREIRGDLVKDPVSLSVLEFDASSGKEFFISFSDANDKLLGFVRLRFPASFNEVITKDSCIVRELHVYGFASPISSNEGNAQHRGLGKKLMKKAEEIALKNNKKKVVVISGVGVRAYYEKLGYYLQGPYVVKDL